MRATSLLGLLLALFSFTACAGETGILLNINASDSEEFAAEIASLRIYVGADSIAEELYYTDERPIEDVNLDGRNIVSDPFSVLVRAGSERSTVVVAVLAYNESGRAIGFGRLPGPVSFLSGKVLEWDVEIGRMSGDVFEADHGCLKWVNEEGDVVHIGRPGDADCDGYLDVEGDCDDQNPFRNPAQPEDCENGIDDDCNGLADAEDDLNGDTDNDGYGACGDPGQRDCNNSNPDVHPGAAEVCNGIDDDCDGSCDSGFDQDQDSVTSCGSLVSGGRCLAIGEPDCDSQDPNSYPGAAEICDGQDNDCNGVCDDDESLDPDNDGFTACGSILGQCGASDDLADCDPGNFYVHPGAHEFCDGVDNDCDGQDDPQFVGCFGAEEGDCYQGIRECKPDSVEPTLCVIDSEPVASAVCEAYEDCGEPDPLACVLAADGLDINDNESCEVTLGDNNAQCEGRVVIIDAPDGADGESCSFTLLGGREQQGYRLGLVAAGQSLGEIGDSVSACRVGLQVLANGPAEKAHVLLSYSSDLTPFHLIDVKITTRRRDTCAQEVGLECDTWPTLTGSGPVPQQP